MSTTPSPAEVERAAREVEYSVKHGAPLGRERNLLAFYRQHRPADPTEVPAGYELVTEDGVAVFRLVTTADEALLSTDGAACLVRRPRPPCRLSHRQRPGPVSPGPGGRLPEGAGVMGEHRAEHRCGACGSVLAGTPKRGWRVGRHPLYGWTMDGRYVRVGFCAGEARRG